MRTKRETFKLIKLKMKMAFSSDLWYIYCIYKTNKNKFALLQLIVRVYIDRICGERKKGNDKGP